MSGLAWDTSLSVGVPSCDKQHQQLFLLIDKLDEAMRKGQGKQIIGGILDELRKYTVTHFTYEEKLLKRIAYADLPRQQAEHKQFVDKLVHFQKENAEGSLALSVSVMGFLKSWLRDHIMKEDAKYGEACKSKGVL